MRLPDPVRVARLEKAPELGPRILFFTGGTAIRDLSRVLILGTHNSIHIVPPFDSGGSSAKLRKAFNMPAIGDARARIMALADQSLRGNPEIYDLFAHRLDNRADGDALTLELDRMVRGKHPLVAHIPDPMRKIIRNHLRAFAEAMPKDFDLRGASIGNLVLTAGYLGNRRMFDPVMYLFSRLVQARGEVRPVANKNIHLAARLEDGSVVVGQHRITGKEVPALRSRIREIFFTERLDSTEPVALEVRQKMKNLIASADLICFPMGSFFTSVLANLLPTGAAEAVAANPCPKVYVPSTGDDPETFGMTLTDQVKALLAVLRRSDMQMKHFRPLDFVLIDSRHGLYPGGVDADALKRLGVEVLDCPIAEQGGRPLLNARKLAHVLLSLS